MRSLLLASLAAVVLAPYAYALAATLTITPDQMVYEVGDTITLNVFGASEGAEDNRIYGRILFDAALADYVSSHQELLGNAWYPATALTGGDGFGEAFGQVASNPESADGPLSASVTLLATTPGLLHYSWLTSGELDFRLDFFGLTDAPGGSVLIVPELSTGRLLGLGIVAIAIGWRSHRRS